MNNLHRELAPVSEPAWAQIAEEATRTFRRNIAGRRVVDVEGPKGCELSAIGTGHVRALRSDENSLIVSQREVQPVIELRVPFRVTRAAVDDVERGAGDSDWQPVKDAARAIAVAEDRAIFSGMGMAGIGGVIPQSSNTPINLPARAEDIPDTVAHALSSLRLAGVDGPYSLLLSSDEYTKIMESTDHGYPIRDHVARLLPEGAIIWAPALEGGLLISTRGGDYELHLGQDLSIGYSSHDSEFVELYLQETFGFLALTAESSVPLSSIPDGGVHT